MVLRNEAGAHPSTAAAITSGFCGKGEEIFTGRRIFFYSKLVCSPSSHVLKFKKYDSLIHLSPTIQKTERGYPFLVKLGFKRTL